MNIPFGPDVPQIYSQNPVAEIIAMPANNGIELTGDADYVQKLKMSMSSDYSRVGFYAFELAQSMETMNPHESRPYLNWIRTFPEAAKARFGFMPWLTPMSEYTAAWFYAHTPDKSTVALDDWANDTGRRPMAIRPNLKYKVGEEYDIVNDAYTKTNRLMKVGISREFKNEGTAVSVTPVVPTITTTKTTIAPLAPTIKSALLLPASHSFHIAADVYFYQTHMSEGSITWNIVGLLYLTRLMFYVNNINYLRPVIDNNIVNTDFMDTYSDGLIVVLDKEGSQAPAQFKTECYGALK